MDQGMPWAYQAPSAGARLPEASRQCLMGWSPEGVSRQALDHAQGRRSVGAFRGGLCLSRHAQLTCLWSKQGQLTWLSNQGVLKCLWSKGGKEACHLFASAHAAVPHCPQRNCSSFSVLTSRIIAPATACCGRRDVACFGWLDLGCVTPPEGGVLGVGLRRRMDRGVMPSFVNASGVRKGNSRGLGTVRVSRKKEASVMLPSGADISGLGQGNVPGAAANPRAAVAVEKAEIVDGAAASATEDASETLLRGGSASGPAPLSGHEVTSAENGAVTTHKSHWQKLGRHAHGATLPAKLEHPIVLGIDFGGTGIKGAPVDVTRGTLVQERFRIATPAPATPGAVVDVIQEIKSYFQWHGPIGFGMPSVVKRGLVRTAANIDGSWVDVRVQEMLEAATGCQVGVLNDADAAGYAEMQFGAGRAYAREGVVLMLTFGTGIGTALFVNGVLVPNLEMGHIEVGGAVAEKVTSAAAREREELSWKKWASRANEYLDRMELYLQPDLIIIGGGISKKDDKFLHLLVAPRGAKVVAAEMRNETGIVGAAVGGHAILQRRMELEEESNLIPSILT